MAKWASSRIWMFAALVLLAVLVVYMVMVPPGSEDSDEEAVAKVNGESITKGTLYDAMVLRSGKEAMSALINKELIRQEAEKAKVKVSQDDIDKEMEDLKKQFGSDEEFEQALASYNMTREDLEDDMKTNATLRKILEPEIKITDEDIKKYYDENLESLKTPEQVKASIISVAKKEEADTILADLKNGADFAETAKAKSTDASTKDKGGDMGYVAKSDLDEAFAETAFALKDGELSGVVEGTDGSFHILKVAEHKAAVTPTMDEKKEEIKDKLFNEQMNTVSSTWIQEKTAAAKIENSLNKGE